MPIAQDVTLGAGVRIFWPQLVNLYGCTIGDETRIGPFVEIQRGVVVGTLGYNHIRKSNQRRKARTTP